MKPIHVVPLLAAALLVGACTSEQATSPRDAAPFATSSTGAAIPEPASEPTKTPASVDAPAACLPSAEARRGTIKGTPEWVRFCPGADGRTAPAEVPSDALTTHLDHLSELTESTTDAPQEEGCSAVFSRTYRVQVGYADGEVAEILGVTDPDCIGTVTGSGAQTRGPEGLGVYGAVMAAFGQQYADSFEPAPSDAPLDCPVDPRDPDSVDIDGSSTSLDTGWHLGKRAPMVMPLAAVRGIVCTWPYSESEPTIRSLTAEEAEQVRIGLHAIFNGMVDCAGSPEPSYTAVVEDKTGTRHAVTIIDSECSTVVRSDGGFGLGFPWLQR